VDKLNFFNKKIVSENKLTIIATLVALLFAYVNIKYLTYSENRALKLEVIQMLDSKIEIVKKYYATARCSKNLYPEKVKISISIYEDHLSRLNNLLRDLAANSTTSGNLLSTISLNFADNSNYELMKVNLRENLNEQEIKKLELYCVH
tara:strand:- start:940 stop:1383 length:444 start_codon:yes stop_codon:yes gene_type:complete